MVGIMFIIMLALIFVGVPVAFSILGSGIWFLLATDMKPLALVCQRAVTGLDSFPLLAVPLFVFVGDLMDRGGISRRMIRWAESFLGWMPGGLGVVTIVSCAVFAALTGSGPATVAAIGSIMIPSLVKNGYPMKTAAGMAAAGGAPVSYTHLGQPWRVPGADELHRVRGSGTSAFPPLFLNADGHRGDRQLRRGLPVYLYSIFLRYFRADRV